MAIRRDFIEYQKSIASELRITQDRVRNLIGDAHWETDGEHKEAVLRRVIRAHISESLRVGKGFVCYRDGTSKQIDILITDRRKPTLFKDGELTLVTPDAVAAIIEVKTSQQGAQIRNTLSKLADDVEAIRKKNSQCVAGLFIYSPPRPDPLETITMLHEVSRGRKKRVVDWVAEGPDTFCRFWSRGEDVHSPIKAGVWHSYVLRGLAQAYFVSNVVCDASGNVSAEMQFPWFPVRGGKERRRQWYVPLRGGNPRSFYPQQVQE